MNRITVNGCVCECVIFALVEWLNLMASTLLHNINYYNIYCSLILSVPLALSTL